MGLTASHHFLCNQGIACLTKRVGYNYNVAIIQDDPRSDHTEELITEGGTVSVQVLSEFDAMARKKTKMP